MFWEVYNQLFGISGLVATILEFIYVLTSKGRFNKFEETFFYRTPAYELLAETGLLLVSFKHLFIVIRNGDYRIARKLVKFLIMHPLYILAGANLNAGISEEEQPMTENTLHAFLYFSIYPVFHWAIFEPVWSTEYGGHGNEGLRWTLSLLSLVLFSSSIYVVFRFYSHSKLTDFSLGQFKFLFSVCSLMYIMGKAFGLYIVLSNKERLMTGTTGKLFVGFQAAKILSVAIFLFHLWAQEEDGQNNNNTEDHGSPPRGVSRQRNCTTSSSITANRCELEGGNGEIV